MKKLILSLATPEIRTIAEPFLQNQKAYAERNGYVYQCAEESVWKDLHPSFSKVALLDKALKDGFETIIWTDSDVAFMDHTKDLADLLADLLRPDYFAAAYQQQNWKEFPFLCCGLMVWANTPEARAFVTEWVSRCHRDRANRFSAHPPLVPSKLQYPPRMQPKPWEQFFFTELIRETNYKNIRACNAWEIGCFSQLWNDGVIWEPGMPTCHMAGDASWQTRAQVFKEHYAHLVKV